MSNTLTGNPDLVTSEFNEPPKNPIVLLNHWLSMADQLGIPLNLASVVFGVNS